MNHTPTPWCHNYDDVLASEDPEDLIATFWHASDGKAVENAEFVVRACNAHHDLVRACKLIVEVAPHVANWLRENDPGAYRQVRVALDKAESK